MPNESSTVIERVGHLSEEAKHTISDAIVKLESLRSGELQELVEHEHSAKLEGDQVKRIEQVIDELGHVLKTGSPLSSKCVAKLDAFEKNPEEVCGNFREALSVSMCAAWRKLEEGKHTGMSDALRESRGEVFGKCKTLEKPP